VPLGVRGGPLASVRVLRVEGAVDVELPVVVGVGVVALLGSGVVGVGWALLIGDGAAQAGHQQDQEGIEDQEARAERRLAGLDLPHGAPGVRVKTCGRGPVPQTGGQEVVWSCYTLGDARNAIMQNLANTAATKTGLKITLKIEPGDHYWDNLQTRVAGGGADLQACLQRLRL